MSEVKFKVKDKETGEYVTDVDDLYAELEIKYQWIYLSFGDKYEIEDPCNNCGLKRSVDEALNSGDGAYRP